MRLLPGRTRAGETRRSTRIAILVVVLTMVPVFAFVLDWRLGVFVTAAYGALAFGA